MKKLLSLVKFALRFMVDAIATLIAIPLVIIGSLVASIYVAIKVHDITEVPKTYVGAWKAALNGAKEGFQTHKCDLLSILES